MIKGNRSSFSKIKVRKSLPTPIYTIWKVRFKYRSQFKLLIEVWPYLKYRNITWHINIDEKSEKVDWDGRRDKFFLLLE